MTRPIVLLLHGIWMPGTVMASMRQRLEHRHGYDCRIFDYPSITGSLDENAKRLAERVGYADGRPVALVGHSLGGLVSLRMLAHWPDVPVARVVCLGSPLMGSKAAAVLARFGLAKNVLGKSLPQAIMSEEGWQWAERAAERAEVGVIAGNRSTGVGKLIADFGGENDGTVSVAETRLPGIRDHLVLPVSHTGMVFSRAVAAQTSEFLQTGAFEHRDRREGSGKG